MTIQEKKVQSWTGKMVRSKDGNVPMLLVTYQLDEAPTTVRQYICPEHQSQFAHRKAREFFATFSKPMPQSTADAVEAWKSLPCPSAIMIEDQGNGKFEVEGYKFPEVAKKIEKQAKQTAPSVEQIIASIRRELIALERLIGQAG